MKTPHKIRNAEFVVYDYTTYTRKNPTAEYLVYKWDPEASAYYKYAHFCDAKWKVQGINWEEGYDSPEKEYITLTEGSCEKYCASEEELISQLGEHATSLFVTALQTNA